MPSTKEEIPKNALLIKAALKVAKHYPVFPTADKLPVWSNAELGVGKGEGGYKIATRDPKQIKKLFSHPRAREIAVPMGEPSGLVCVDADLYKGEEVEAWLEANRKTLGETRIHRTRSGGLHFLYKYNPLRRLPAQLRNGVDIKGQGGYVCWPPTGNYVEESTASIKEFPVELLNSIERDGRTVTLSSWNQATDEELIQSILDASDLYPALRSLSYRLPTRRDEDGVYLDKQQQMEVLQAIMQESVASDPAHKRHHDWLDRNSKIPDLVESAVEKHSPENWLTAHEQELILGDGESFVNEEALLRRPIGPQQETRPERIRALAEAIEESDPQEEFETFTVGELREKRLPDIEWLIEGMLPQGGISSLGGTSNVGKTRWLAALCAAISSGDTEPLGLPPCKRTSVLWVANEEHCQDIQRRIKAAAQHYGVKDGEVISVRPKTEGTFRLVALNEISNPELDAENIARIVAQAKRIEAQLIIFDPYVTLSDAMDENSATSAAMLTKAFLHITSLTGSAVLHAHHTPKDRTKDNDWYRGDASAWRGSGAIYSALDCGFTLANWMPRERQRRKEWKEKYLSSELSRWVVLDTGKIREGKPTEPIVYELVGEELPEGYEIGVSRLSTEHEAGNSLLYENADIERAVELALQIIGCLGEGSFEVAEVHRVLKGSPLWLTDASKLQESHKQELLGMFGETIDTEDGQVRLVLNERKKSKGRWVFQVSR